MQNAKEQLKEVWALQQGSCGESEVAKRVSEWTNDEDAVARPAVVKPLVNLCVSSRATDGTCSTEMRVLRFFQVHVASRLPQQHLKP